MTSQAEQNVMVPYVLRSLIVISAARSWSPDQRQPQRVVVRFVGGVFAISEYGGSVSAALIGEIDPLVRGNFKLPLFFVGTLNCADVPVVGRQIVAGAQREGRLQVGFLGLPVDVVGELDAIAGVARRKANNLDELRAFRVAFDLQRHPRRSVLDYRDFRR